MLHQETGKFSSSPYFKRVLIIHYRWLYSLFLAIDTNFHLKHHLVSSDAKDPGLSQGWGYFVEERNYKAYLQENGTLTQVVSLVFTVYNCH